jgi:hypothetical protein
MKKNKLVFVVTSIVLILLLLINATFKSKHFDVNINVTNNTSLDLDIEMSILLHKENTSTSEKILSMATIKKGTGNKQIATVNAPEGDFGLILKIEEKDNSLYFISGAKLSYVNYDLEFEEASNGDLIMKGEVKSKKIFSTIGTNEIKPIVVKESDPSQDSFTG